MHSKAYILQNFCIIDSMKLYNQGFPFLYNKFYQGGANCAGGGGGAGPPPPALATPLSSVQFLIICSITLHGERTIV
jgi:hypothetical protein